MRKRVLSAFEQREAELSAGEMRKIERYLLLSKIDEKWKDHLRAMDQLRSGIGLRGYAQIDPKIAYKKEGYELFERMIAAVEEEVTQLLFRVRLVSEEEERERLARRWGGAVEERLQAAGMAAGAAEPSVGGDGSLASVMERTQKRQQRDERAAAATSRDTGPKRPDRRVAPKVGRNDPCTCGSGRKFKKCCGKA
jgi:preprotein translocase subunit SecA